MEERAGAIERVRQQPLLAGLLALCLAGVFAMVFLPIGWWLNRLVVRLYYLGRRLGMPHFVTLEWYDVALNVLLFAVPTALAALLWPRVRPWVWTLAVLLISAGIELVQYLALPRDASLGDVVANTAGAVVGALVSVVLLRRRRHSAARRRGGVPE